MKYKIIILLISLALLFLLLPQHLLHPQNYLPDQNDSLLITYIQNQVQSNLLSPQKSLYFAHFFAPFKNTLTYSELFLTSSFLTLPAKLFTQSPLVIYNLNLFSGFLLTALASYLLILKLTSQPLPSLLGSLLFTFSGYHLSYLPHLQVFNLYLLPLALLFLHYFLKSRRPLHLILFLVSFTAQFADSFFTSYLVFFASAIILLSFIKLKRSSFFLNRQSLLLILPFVIVCLFLVLPYLKLHSTFPNVYRPIRDTAHFSLGLEEIFTKYHGTTLVAIFSASFLFSRFCPKKLKPNQQTHLYPYYLILFFSLIMSLGPVLKFSQQTVKILGLPLPLPYALFYYLFPGFKGLRTPGRWIILASLAASVITSLKLTPLFSKLKNKTVYLFLILTSLLLILEAKPPLKSYYFNPTPPPVYQKVKSLPPESIILELPVKLWNMENNQIESLRSLYSLYHQKRRFNGYSGFAPQDWIVLVQRINKKGLTPEIISQLKSLGITHLVEDNQLKKL